MTENNEVAKKRQEIKAEINGGEYRSLARVILDGTGRIIQRLTFSKKPPSFWYNSLVFAVVTLLFCTSIAIPQRSLITDLPPEIGFKLGVAALLGVLFGSSLVIAAALTHNRLLSTLSDSVLDAIQSEDDLSNLRSWLAASFNMKGQLLVSLVPALIILPLLNILFFILTEIYINMTTHIVAIIGGFQALLALPIVLASFTMPHRLSNYQLKLFSADPSSSEVVDRLSDTVNSILLTVGVLLAFLSVVAALLIPEITGTTFVFVLLTVPWGLLIIVFISGQYALAKIINKAKWKTLNGIQAQIERLQEQERILSEKTLGHINELLDYHNRIRTTRNSALDIRAGLSFLQSLLLPVIGLLLANLLDVFKILSNLTAGK
jgi:hypothetical protein